MSNLIKFYTDVLKSVDLKVSDDGFINTETETGDKMVIHAGKPLVMPTKEQIANLTKVENGEVVIKNVLFNPLVEDEVKGESPSLIKLKKLIDHRLKYSIHSTIVLLLNLAKDKELQDKASLDLMSFIGTLKGARKNIGNAEIVDDKTIANWGKVFDSSLKGKNTTNLSHIYMKKKGVINGTTYNRLSSLDFPLYNILEKLKKNEPLLGVKLRVKDKEVFKLVLQYIFPDIAECNLYKIGSQDNKSPGFISLYKLYLTIGDRLNDLNKQLEFIDEYVSDVGMIKSDIKISDVDNVTGFANELALIPSDLDVNRSKKRLLGDVDMDMPAADSGNGKLNAKALLNGTLPQQQQQQQHYAPQQQQAPQQQVQVDTSSMTPAQKILYGNNPQNMPQNNTVSRPIGVNSVQQQVPQQQQYAPPPQGQVQQQYIPPQQGYAPQQQQQYAPPPQGQPQQQGYIPPQQQQYSPPQQGYVPQQQQQYAPPQPQQPRPIGVPM